MTDLEINRAVHEALGGCKHEWTEQRISLEEVGIKICCKKCNVRGECYKYSPYTTDPRLWWPLAWEMLKDGYCICAELCGLSLSHNATAYCIKMDDETGRNVCKAYLQWLKTKGEKK